MELQNNLDTIGSLQINPLAELLAEIAHNQLNGSLRMANAQQKTAVYFDAGEVVFAASNARQHRLAETLLEAGALTGDQLAAVADSTNDLALKENLIAGGMLEKEEIERLASRQIAKILKAALAWQTGEWTFSPLVRIKGDVRHQVNWRNLQVEYARELAAEEIARKFNNPQECFRPKPVFPADVALSPPESFVYTRFENQPLTIEAIQTLSGLPESETRRVVYALWLGGLIVRENWSAAFTERKIAAILSARLALKKDAAPPTVIQPIEVKTEPPSVVEAGAAEEQPTPEVAATENQLSLEEYLTRVERAANFYEIFALPSTLR